jgi:two-component system sensor histidine kinase CpxA
MRSLYLKVLAWFLVTVAVTGVGLWWVTFMNWTRAEQSMPPFRRITQLEFELARRAYEQGGREELARHQAWVKSMANFSGVLTDARGRDLASGEDYSDVIARLGEDRPFAPPGAPVVYQGRLVNGFRSLDGRYWFLHRQFGGSGRRYLPVPSYIWVLGSVLLLSLWLAHHLTKPLRELRDVVERFGSGDMAARVSTSRLDEVGQLGRAFNAMAERTGVLVDSQRRLLTDLSHELRSPLTRLGLAVELARSGDNRDAALDRIQREADRLNSMVAGLLEVTRGEFNPSAVTFAPLRLDELVAGIVEDCRVDATERGCRIEFKLPIPVTVRGNEELLRRAVENILRNAVRYSPPGEAVCVVATASAGRASVTVRDRGPGVPPTALPHLFDAFYRVAQTGPDAGKGFGLGLSIARRAVELHHGTIAACNANPGLEVTISLPAT